MVYTLPTVSEKMKRDDKINNNNFHERKIVEQRRWDTAMSKDDYPPLRGLFTIYVYDNDDISRQYKIIIIILLSFRVKYLIITRCTETSETYTVYTHL